MGDARDTWSGENISTEANTDVGRRFKQKAKQFLKTDLGETEHRVYTVPQKGFSVKDTKKTVQRFKKGKKSVGGLLDAASTTPSRSQGVNEYISFRQVTMNHENELHSNGLTTVNLEPDARIFICGKKIQGFEEVSVTQVLHVQSVQPGTCKIKLRNYNNKYRVTKNNLEDKWLDEEQEKKDIFRLKALSYRPVFEDRIVFGMNDPVVVFLKDRFTPFWRFGFTGYISKIDDLSAFNNDLLTITCEDVTRFVQMKRYNINPALIDPTFNRNSLSNQEISKQSTEKFYSGKDALFAIETLFFGLKGAQAEVEKDLEGEEWVIQHTTLDSHPTSSVSGLYVLEGAEKTGYLSKKEYVAAVKADWEKTYPKLKWGGEKDVPGSGVHGNHLIIWKRYTPTTEGGRASTIWEDTENQETIREEDPDEDKIALAHYNFLTIDGERPSTIKKATRRSGNATNETKASRSGFGSFSLGGRDQLSFELGKIKELLDTQIEKLGNSGAVDGLAEIIYSNVGFFKGFVHKIKGAQEGEDDIPIHLSTEIDRSMPGAPLYTELPRYFMTRMHWGKKGSSSSEYSFDILGCQGTNPLLTEEFVESFDVATSLMKSMEGVSSAKALDALTPEGTLIVEEAPYPYDFIRMNILGSPHTTPIQKEEILEKVFINPRLIIAIPEVHAGGTGYVVSRLKFRSFDLGQTDSESAADILQKTLEQTDMVSWATPMGDFIVEPHYYDTNPWDWEERAIKPYSQAPRNTFVFDSVENKEAANLVDHQGKEFKWAFKEDSFLNQVVELKDELQTTVTTDSKKFVSSVEVKGTLSPLVETIDPIQQALHGVQSGQDGDSLSGAKGQIPHWILVKDGYKLRLKDADKPRTVGGRAAMINSNAYDPVHDFVREYGFSTQQTPSTLLGLNNTRACIDYSKILFNRYLSEAYAINDVTVFGRPGLLVNRPVYIRSRNSIVTPRAVTTTLKWGSNYTTVFQTNYLRNQTFLKKFAMGDGKTTEEPSASDPENKKGRRLRKKWNEADEKIGELNDDKQALYRDADSSSEDVGRVQDKADRQGRRRNNLKERIDEADTAYINKQKNDDLNRAQKFGKKFADTDWFTVPGTGLENELNYNYFPKLGILDWNYKTLAKTVEEEGK